MPNNFRRKQRVPIGIESHIDEIIGRLANNSAVEKAAKLPFNVTSLQKNFTAQINLLLEENFARDDRAAFREILSLDECKIFSDDETFMFVKIFGDGAGLFGFGEAGGNFKILSLCSADTGKTFDRQAAGLLFTAFTKTFLPKVDTSEIIAVLSKNHFFAVQNVIFEFVQTGKLNMLNVFAE